MTSVLKRKLFPLVTNSFQYQKRKCVPWEKKYLRIRNSVVGAVTVTDWTIWGSKPVRGKIFSSSPKVQTHSGAHPISNSVGTGAFSSGLKKPGYADDHSLQAHAEVKNKWSSASTPLTCHHVVDSDSFTSFTSTAQNLIQMALLD
jgi:hypothetical protein